MRFSKFFSCVLAAMFATSASAAIKIVLPVNGGFAQNSGASSAPQPPEKPESDCALFDVSNNAQIAGSFEMQNTKNEVYHAFISSNLAGFGGSCNYSLRFEYRDAMGSVICETPSANISGGFVGGGLWVFDVYGSGFIVAPNGGQLTAGSCAELSRKVCDGVAPGALPSDYNFTNVVQVFNYVEGDFTHTFSVKYDRDKYFNEPC